METASFQPQLEEMLQWSREGLNEKEMESRLIASGLSENESAHIISAYKKLRTEKKRLVGFLCCGAGGGLLLLSFLITLILFDTNHDFGLYLYGLTFIGIAVIFKGMIDILGW